MQAVILAGGEGSRLRPLTRSRPKALIPVANRPILDYVIEAVTSAGIQDITVVVGYRKEQVLKYLNSLETEVTTVVQKKQLGTADALLCATDYVDGSFLVLPGDNYISPLSVQKMREEKCAVLAHLDPNPAEYGVISAEEGSVRFITEKPAVQGEHLISTGVYTMCPDIFGFLNDGLDLPGAVNQVISHGTAMHIVMADAWFDAIYPWSLLPMNRFILKGKKSTDIAGNSRKNVVISGNVRVGKGTVLEPNSTIIGPVVIGEDCHIGPNATIMPFTSVGNRVTVEPFSLLSDSLIMDDTSIGSHSTIRSVVAGTGCILSDHVATIADEHCAQIQQHYVPGSFSAILGDHVTCAPFTVFKGCRAGNGTRIEEGRTLSGELEDNTVVR